MTTHVDGVTIRPFESTEEFRACVDLQEATWGGGFSERVSPAILKVGQILGGVSAGAYDEAGTLVGFVFGLTGVRDGEVVHWSDMLAVRPEARDRGLGWRLKAYQREELLGRGVTTMYWTFDPLQARNAYLNLERLGAVSRSYEQNMYGDTDSPLHRGIGTDRLVALWLLDSPRVEARMARARPEVERPPAFGTTAPRALSARDGGDAPRPGEPDLGLGDATVRVSIPSDIGSIMDADIGLAVSWREATRAVFVHYLSVGYEVAGFERGSSTSDYILRTPQDDTR